MSLDYLLTGGLCPVDDGDDDMKTYSDETLYTLHNCDLMRGGTVDGVSFVRCIPHAPGIRFLPAADAAAVSRRVVAEINDPGVIVAYNSEFGGDYVRVDVKSATYRFICHMKS